MWKWIIRHSGKIREIPRNSCHASTYTVEVDSSTEFPLIPSKYWLYVSVIKPITSVRYMTQSPPQSSKFLDDDHRKIEAVNKEILFEFNGQTTRLGKQTFWILFKLSCKPLIRRAKNLNLYLPLLNILGWALAKVAGQIILDSFLFSIYCPYNPPFPAICRTPPPHMTVRRRRQYKVVSSGHCPPTAIPAHNI